MSELVDQITLSEEAKPEGLKKEIVINLGDLVARETAAEAKRIAENAQNASSRAEAIAYDAFNIIGPPTSSSNANLIILACSLNNYGVPFEFTSEEESYFRFYFGLDDDGYHNMDNELEDYKGNIYTLVEGYNSIFLPWLGARLEMLVSFNALPTGYIETDWLSFPAFSFVNSVVSSQLSATIMAAVRMSQHTAEPIPVTEYTNNEVVNANVQEIYFPYSDYSFEVEGGKLLIYKEGLLVTEPKLKQGFNHLSFTDGNSQRGIDIVIKSDAALENIEGEAFQVLSPAHSMASSPIIYAYYEAINKAINKATENAVNEVAYPLAKQAASNEIFFDQVSGKGLPKMAYMLNGASYFKIEREVSLSNNTNIFKDNKVKDVLYLDCSGVSNIGGNPSIFDCQPYFGGTNSNCLKSIVMDKVTTNNVRYLFFALKELEFLNILSIDASAATSLYWTFGYCQKIKKIDLRNWGLRKVNDMRLAFGYCYELEELYIPSDICADDTTGTIAFGSVLEHAKKLKIGDLSMFSGKKCTEMPIFRGCNVMTDINLGTIDFSDIAKSVDYLFHACYALVNFSGMLNMPVSYSLEYSPLLSHESAMNCIERLKDLTEGGTKEDYTPQTLTFHPDVTAQLSEEEIAIATAKGWTIA